MLATTPARRFGKDWSTCEAEECALRDPPTNELCLALLCVMALRAATSCLIIAKACLQPAHPIQIGTMPW